MKKTFFALLMGLICTMTAADVITLPVLEAPGIIDGDLSDPCWSKAYKTGPFHLVSGKMITEKTEGFLFRDKEALYVAIRCYFDDYAAKEQLGKTAKGAFRGDNVEVFIDPGSTGKYAHFSVNLAGDVFFLGKQENIAFGIQLHKIDWTMEAKIPYTALKLPLGVKFNKNWRINLGRGLSEKKEFTSWMKLPSGSFHDPDHFQQLAGIPVDLEKIRAIQIERNKGVFEIAMDHILYTKETIAKVTADLKYKKSMKKFRIEASITDAAGKTVQKQTVTPVFFKNEFEIPVAELPAGKYQLELDFVNADGKVLESNRKTFWKIPPKTAKTPGILTIKDGSFFKDGKFFFPVIVWICTAKDVGTAKTAGEYWKKCEILWQELKEHGFNMLITQHESFPEEAPNQIRKLGRLPGFLKGRYDTGRKLGITFGAIAERAAKYGLCIAVQSPYIAYRDFGDEHIEAFIKQLLRLRDNPRIALWHTADETDGQFEENQMRSQLYHEIDPDRKTWLTVINAVGQNADYCDVIGTDPYPIPNGKVTMVSSHADRLIKSMKPGQSRLIWLQNFGGEGGWKRAPNKEELRCMTFLALNHGIKGIAYFNYTVPERRNGVRQNKEAWESLKTLTQEIQELAPAFCLGKRLYLGMQNDLDIAVIEYKGEVMTSIVNTLPKAAAGVAVKIPGRSDITVDLAPYEVKIIR